MSSSKYCRLCNGPCDDCSTCLRNPDRFNPSTDMIKTALEKKRAFTGSTFQTISKDPPKISVTNRADGGSDVAVRLTSMPFMSAYRDRRSPERRELEKAAREEIIRSFDICRDRVKETDIEVYIREGSVLILMALNVSIIAIAAVEIAGICSIDTTEADRDLPFDKGESACAPEVSFYSTDPPYFESQASCCATLASCYAALASCFETGTSFCARRASCCATEASCCTHEGSYFASEASCCETEASCCATWASCYAALASCFETGTSCCARRASCCATEASFYAPEASCCATEASCYATWASCFKTGDSCCTRRASCCASWASCCTHEASSRATESSYFTTRASSSGITDYGTSHVPARRYTARDKAKDIKTVASGATGAVMGATAGSVAGPVGMAIGGAIGYIGGTLLGDALS